METHGNGGAHESSPAGMTPPPGTNDERYAPPGTVTGQLRTLFKDASLLVRQELQLARAELMEKVSVAKKGAGMLAASAAFLFIGLIGLFGTLMWVLSIWMPLWLSTLIVSASALLIGGVLFGIGRSSVEPSHLTPDRTVESLKQDQRLVQEHLP